VVRKGSHFDRAALPPGRTFYEAELGRLSRPSRGWARGNCPFHQSKSKLSFSVHLESGAFYCFGCGVKGADVVSFVRLRDRCDFKAACQTLGAWRGDISPAETQRLRRIQQERERHRIAQAEQKELERTERVNACAELRAAETLYREAIQEHDIELMADLLPRVRDLEERYYCLAGLEVRHGEYLSTGKGFDLGISPTAQEIGFSCPSREVSRG
jgi:CHC2-type zinc finger protein